MHHHHNRTVKINKQKLIDKIKENKSSHITEFNTAVAAYRVEANKQLENLKKDLENGSLTIAIKLTTPINRTDEYDKVIQMFEWEVENEIELTQAEFNEYVHDDNERSRTAKFANSFYSSSF